MPYSTKALANEFLRIAKSRGKPISPMKLQKLLYFAHGWCLGLTGESLANEKVGAWDWGPVFPTVYHEFKAYGTEPIQSLAKHRTRRTLEFKEATLPTNTDTDKVRDLIQRVWDVYGGFTAVQLSNMTHEPGTPWSKTVAPYGGDIPRNLTIPDDVIKDYFAKQVEGADGR